MASINERFMDFQVAQQVRWIRVQNRDVREALAILRRVENNLKQILQNSGLGEVRFTEARLNALRDQVSNLIRALEAELTPVLVGNVRDALQQAAEVEQAAFVRILPAGLDVTTPNLGVLQTAATSSSFNGATITEWASSFHRSLTETTWRTIVDGITSGTTTDDLVRELLGTRSARFKDGALQARRRGLEALVRTSVNHATNQGRQMVWEANTNLIKGVRWVSTLDTRTTPICRDRDGKVGPVVDDPDWSPPPGSARLDPPFARPPAHVNCRSTTVAITKSWKELGFDMEDLPPATRASMDGQVPASTTYFEWLNRQSAATQSEVLGPARMKLWKEGGITPDRFQNDAGHFYTLAELKRRQPQAFKDAGI
uniref:Head morphogenesis protein n=1 Tax=Dinoroseobacter phage vB_DshS_R26L TaxID=3161158 RepID=A0AAU7VGI4_9CAUD